MLLIDFVYDKEIKRTRARAHIHKDVHTQKHILFFSNVNGDNYTHILEYGLDEHKAQSEATQGCSMALDEAKINIFQSILTAAIFQERLQ